MEELSNIQKKAVDVTGIDPRKTSPKGWIYGKCPFCGHSEKFGVKMNYDRSVYHNHLSFNCFRGSCGEKGTEYHLFKHFDILHLLRQKDHIPFNAKLDSGLKKVATEGISIETPERLLPVGWKRIYEHSYLEGRGWDKEQFEKYPVGVAKIYSPLKDYVIFLTLENGINKGYVARCILDDIWRENYNKEVKLHNKSGKERRKIIPKWFNEPGVDFSSLLYGIDELTPQTKTVILVEGLTDKSNTDKVLHLHQSQKTKCLCTFGKKISQVQIEKLNRKGIENVFLLFDPDAILSGKQSGIQLENSFNVKIGHHPTKDPGEMRFKDFNYCFETAQSVINFHINKV